MVDTMRTIFHREAAQQHVGGGPARLLSTGGYCRERWRRERCTENIVTTNHAEILRHAYAALPESDPVPRLPMCR